MIIIDNKIEVTIDMMERAGMTRLSGSGLQFGVPDSRGSLKWRTILEMEDSDFDAIEEYFLKKQAN